MRTVVISGLSGAGKTTAVRALEDLGFYCIDNLPVPFLPRFVELAAQSAEGIQKIALVIDARDKAHIRELPRTMEELSYRGVTVELVFFEASDEVLIRRFSETRRRHPLSPSGSAEEGISLERELLGPVRDIAQIVLNTSNFSTNDLRKELLRVFESTREEKKLTVVINSFGFKYGLPLNADLVFDVRFLQNPYFRKELKDRTGLDSEVIQFVTEQKDYEGLMERLKQLLVFLVPRFEREGKSYLQLAVGCTGGRHRSVVVAGRLMKMIQEMGFQPSINHRDVEN